MRAPPMRHSLVSTALGTQTHEFDFQLHRPLTIALTSIFRLESPPVRVCGADTPFPLVFEPLYLPTAQRVADAVVESFKY